MKFKINESLESNLIDRFFKDSSWIDEIRDRLQYLNQKDLEIEYNEDPIVKLIIDNAHEYNTEDSDYEGIIRDFINFTDEFMFYINDEDKESFNELINENPFMKTFFEIYNREWPDWDKIEESLQDKIQYGVHQFSTESIIFRGTEEECIKYIDDRPELWDDAEVYFMTPDDPHYQKNESLEEDMKYYPQDYDKIDLEYENLDLEDRVIDWTYEIDKEDLYTFIFESCLTEQDFPAAFEKDFDPNNEEDWNSFVTWLEDNFDEIFTKCEDKILDHFRNNAIEDAEMNYNPDDLVDPDTMPGGHDDYRFDESIDKGDNMKFKLVEAAESKICCICKKPFEGYGNNAEPVCSGTCSDECNMKEVIPARIRDLKKSKIDESLSTDARTFLLNRQILLQRRKYMLFVQDMCSKLNDSDILEVLNRLKDAGIDIYYTEVLEYIKEQRPEIFTKLGLDKIVDSKSINEDYDGNEEDEIDESLNEGNSVSGKIPSALDSFLQDIAQMHQTIDYSDIMDHDYTEDDIRKLNNLRRRFITWAQYDEDDEEVKAKFNEIANKVAEILKRVDENMNEGRNDPYFTPYGYRAAAKVLNRTAPEYYWHLKEIEMDKGDGIKLANYALKKGLPVMLDKNSDPDYPEFYLKDGSSEYHWGDYFYTYGFVNPDAADLVPYEGNLDILNAEKDDNKMNEVFGDIVNYESAEDWIKRIESQEGQISIFDDEDKDTFEKFARDVYFYAKNNGFKRVYVEDDFIQFKKTSNIPEGELATYIDIFGNTHEIYLSAQIGGSDGFLIGEKVRPIHNMAELKSGINEIKNEAVENIKEREIKHQKEQEKEQEIAQKYAAFDDDMDFDIDESHETRLMDSLYEGSDDFDDHDDEEIIEDSDDSEDDERWDNDIIADAYDDEI